MAQPEPTAEAPTADQAVAPAKPTAEEATPAHETVALEVLPAPGTTPALAAPSSDRCSSCGNPLAADQRYCVECGDRRGAARFALPPPAPVGYTERVRVSHRRRPAMGASGALIAGVATLLLAMGVGVLIGQSGSSTATASRTPPVQVVTVSGGGGAASTKSVSSSPTHKTAKSSKSKSKSKAPSATAATPKPVVKNLPPATVTVGAKGHGPGFQNGKFTGHFFGP
jgi:hypothetical protein